MDYLLKFRLSKNLKILQVVPLTCATACAFFIVTVPKKLICDSPSNKKIQVCVLISCLRNSYFTDNKANIMLFKRNLYLLSIALCRLATYSYHDYISVSLVWLDNLLETL